MKVEGAVVPKDNDVSANIDSTCSSVTGESYSFELHMSSVEKH